MEYFYAVSWTSSSVRFLGPDLLVWGFLLDCVSYFLLMQTHSGKAVDIIFSSNNKVGLCMV